MRCVPEATTIDLDAYLQETVIRDGRSRLHLRTRVLGKKNLPTKCNHTHLQARAISVRTNDAEASSARRLMKVMLTSHQEATLLATYEFSTNHKRKDSRLIPSEIVLASALQIPGLCLVQSRESAGQQLLCARIYLQ